MFSFPSLNALAFAVLAVASTRASEIERIWITHAGPAPDSAVVNWETEQALDAAVEYGPTEALGNRVEQRAPSTIHHVQIPLPESGPCFYQVRSGEHVSAVQRLREAPSDTLRVVVIADAGYSRNPWSEAVLREHPHLVLTAGDNVPALHPEGADTTPDDTTAFRKWIDSAPQLFRSTPMIPALGNHDREVRRRGPKPPPEPVYDQEATAFREFFALPGDEWKWAFDAPKFGARFVALDFSHLSDFGTTWQTCHPYQRDSAQWTWYRDLIAESRQPFLITLYNEQNSRVRGLEKGEWGRMINRGTLAITGFGYFAERAEVDGFTYYNTALNGMEAQYPDPRSAFIRSADNFVLLTFHTEPKECVCELKDLSGAVLDRKVFRPRF